MPISTRSLTLSIAGTALSGLALAGCTAGSTAPAQPTSSASASGTAKVGGVADPTGKCVEKQSTPTGSKKTFTIADCDLVDVMGSGNTITVGATEHLVVEGNDNTVTIEAAAEVTTLGKNNTVTYEGKEPTFNERGSGNTVRPVVDADGDQQER